MEDRTVLFAQLGIGGIVVFVGILILYGGMSPADPPPLPKPPPPIEETTEELKFSPPIYQALIEQDARRYNVAVPSLDQLAQVIPYFDEIRGSRPLRVGKPVDTRHLRVALSIAKHQATIDGQAFRTDHFILTIANKTDKYLAYRVMTQIPSTVKCGNKGDIQHNAIVLPPGREVQRTECLYREGLEIALTGVEVMELLPLSATYVSRLPPTLVLYDARTASGHVPLVQPLCRQTVNWQDIRSGVEKNEFDWKDLIDFYARHSCDEYTFFRSYRYRTDPSGPLPVRPMRE